MDKINFSQRCILQEDEMTISQVILVAVKKIWNFYNILIAIIKNRQWDGLKSYGSQPSMSEETTRKIK